MRGGTSGQRGEGQAASSRGKQRVLHVDDEPIFRKMILTHLDGEHGLDVTSVQGPREALEALEESDFDCIVSDHQMPGRTGLELLEDVRENHSDIPFILLTGRGSEEIASEAISAGVTDYVQKEAGPDQFETLAHRIDQAVDRRRTALREERIRASYEALLERSPIPTFVADVDDGGPPRIHRVNPAMERLVGVDADDLEGRGPEALPWADGAAPERWRRCTATGRPIRHPAVPPSLGDGEPREVHLVPVEVRGEVVRILGVLTPVRQPEIEVST